MNLSGSIRLNYSDCFHAGEMSCGLFVPSSLSPFVSPSYPPARFTPCPPDASVRAGLKGVLSSGCRIFYALLRPQAWQPQNPFQRDFSPGDEKGAKAPQPGGVPQPSAEADGNLKNCHGSKVSSSLRLFVFFYAILLLY